MFIGFFINLILGFIFVYVGFLIWKKKKINLIHAYHYKNVKAEDREAYMKEMGISLIIGGISLLISAVFEMVSQKLSVVFMLLGIFVMLFKIFKAQKKYNGGLF